MRLSIFCLLLLGGLLGCNDQRASDQRVNAGQIQVSRSVIIEGVRPEMLDWWWDNLDEERYIRWHPNHQGFHWLVAPHQPQHLGYSQGAAYETTETLNSGQIHQRVRYLSHQELDTPVSAPYFLAADINIEGFGQLRLILEYWVTGEQGRDTAFISHWIGPPGFDAGLLEALAEQQKAELQLLSTFLPDLFKQAYVVDELHQRGHISHGLQANGEYLLEVEQTIEHLTPAMLDWWWDHIGTTDRYQRWHPTAHVSFEWLTPPQMPDHQYDIGATQRVIEYLGQEALVFHITGADPEEVAERIVYPQHLFYAKTELAGYYLGPVNQPLITPVVPPQTTWLLHEWTENPEGPGIVLRSTFSLPSASVVLSLPDDLGWHAIEEFQFLSYALPTLYAAESDEV